MDYTCKVRSLQSLVKDMNKGTIVLTHKLQRPEGQWTRKQKADLIDSLLRKYPINPTYGLVEENGKIAIIDGVQRLSAIRDFVNDKYALVKNMDAIIVDGEEKNLSGLKFSKLDENVQSDLLNSELQIYKITDYTEKDIREIFRRQNAGKPLTSKLVRVVYESDDFNNMIRELSTNALIYKVLTPKQRKNGTDRDVIIQTIMLIATNQEHQFTSFRAKDIDNFVIEYADQYLDVKDTLEEAMNKLDAAYDDLDIPVTSLPQILYACYKIVKNKKSFGTLVSKITEFLNTYNDNAEYKLFVQQGTTSSENVDGRFQYWRAIVNELN